MVKALLVSQSHVDSLTKSQSVCLASSVRLYIPTTCIIANSLATCSLLAPNSECDDSCVITRSLRLPAHCAIYSGSCGQPVEQVLKGTRTLTSS